MKLKEYKNKRNFSKTSEPSGESLNNNKEKATSQKLKNLEKEKQKNKKEKLFVIQHHLARREHYDLRLEYNGVLISFAVPKGLSFNPRDKRLAVKVEDHPIEYANFEGVIPKGEYGGGVVMLWDRGSYREIESFKTGLKKGILKFEVFGERIKGKWTLIKLKNDEDNWLIVKENDEFIKKSCGITGFTKSIKSGLTFKQIEKQEEAKIIKNPFKKVDCKLAKLVDEVPKNFEYVSEIKFDGYRILAFIENGKVRLKTRNNIDFTKKFVSVCESLEEFFKDKTLVLDGEIIVQDKFGRSDFGALQSLTQSGESENLIYMIFDLIAFNGEDLRNLTLLARKERLNSLLKNAPLNLQFSQHEEFNINGLFTNACLMGLEGIILKKKDSLYNGKRDDDWLKLKCYKLQEFVVGGYVISTKKEHGISALLLGVYENNKLIYMGKAGTGINKNNALELKKHFKNLETNISPFENLKSSREKVVFLKPKLVANIQFAEVTKENNLRQASFKGLREDKKAIDVVLEVENKMDKIKKNKNGKNKNDLLKKEKNKPKKEQLKNKLKNVQQKEEDKTSKKIGNSKESLKTTKKQDKKNNNEELKKSNKKLKESSNAINDGRVEVCKINITNPDKIVFEKDKIKKIDIINYYEKVSKRMLKYVSNRLLSVVRCHNKLECFYKKHPNVKSKFIKTKKVEGKSEKEEYFYINSKEGLILEAQLGTIEFHVWGSKVDSLNKPDIMVFDLDPDENLDLKAVREGVKDLKKILDSLKIKAFLKTSGGKGYHILVPFKKSANSEKFRAFSEQIAKLMEEKWENKYTTNIRKENRKGKILIDYFRNTKGATSVAPYSVRARAGAKVSMPISWKELNKISPDGIDIFEAIERMKKPDPWKNFFNVNQSIK